MRLGPRRCRGNRAAAHRGRRSWPPPRTSATAAVKPCPRWARVTLLHRARKSPGRGWLASSRAGPRRGGMAGQEGSSGFLPLALQPVQKRRGRRWPTRPVLRGKHARAMGRTQPADFGEPKNLFAIWVVVCAVRLADGVQAERLASLGHGCCSLGRSKYLHASALAGTTAPCLPVSSKNLAQAPTCLV